jgi:hypothetical protein
MKTSKKSDKEKSLVTTNNLQDLTKNLCKNFDDFMNGKVDLKTCGGRVTAGRAVISAASLELNTAKFVKKVASSQFLGIGSKQNSYS